MALAAADLVRVRLLGAPVLFVDTCMLLDLVRDISRDDVQPHNISQAMRLLEMAEKNDLVVVMAAQVQLELADNQQAVLDAARSGLQKFLDRVHRVDDVARAFGITGSTATAHLVDHVARAEAVLQRWATAATLAPAGADTDGRAMRRVTQARAPARKGKESAKDCLVVESYLEVAEQLRAGGFIGRIVFASSNTQEYVDVNTRALHRDLQADFGVHVVDYAPNFPAAKHSLGL
jgi:hypothetical protein